MFCCCTEKRANKDSKAELRVETCISVSFTHFSMKSRKTKVLCNFEEDTVVIIKVRWEICQSKLCLLILVVVTLVIAIVIATKVKLHFPTFYTYTRIDFDNFDRWPKPIISLYWSLNICQFRRWIRERLPLIVGLFASDEPLSLTYSKC